ncbi:MAG: zf-HC2 domain-containing protein [Alphaproteobacteria bacterium]|nr:zf-HC2 domain-containing protein [Alphaproteobacteria bacterium]
MVSCKTIIAHLSEYLDGEATPEMRQTIERHLRGCHRCNVVYDSTRKMLIITGDERIFEVPTGFSDRLHRFLDDAVLEGPPAQETKK